MLHYNGAAAVASRDNSTANTQSSAQELNWEEIEIMNKNKHFMNSTPWKIEPPSN